MKRITPDEIGKWRVEIENAEDFRDKEFGKYKKSEFTKAGENIDYFEYGISGRYINDVAVDEQPVTTVNVVYPIVKNIIPTLYYKNPYVSAIPKRIEDEDSAPYAGAILNYYYKELDIKAVNKQIVFDAFVLGMGICKIGYTTRFGTSPTEDSIEEERKEREKAKTRGIMERLGLRKPKPEEKPKQNPELNEYIRSESPFVCWVNPFEFVIDPRATRIEDAQWVAQKITKRLSEVKENPAYSNTSTLEGIDVDRKDVPAVVLDEFKTIDLYEIHYKTDEGIYILTLAKDQNEYKALRHEKSAYEMDGFQYELMYFNKHNHKLYPKSDISIFKGLQDRVNLTFENVLDQVDRYVPKIAVDETKVTEAGKKALRDGDIGSIVYTNSNPSECIKEVSFTQLKADLNALMDRIIDVIMLETGLTKAQLLGMTSAETATEAQIGQAGQNLRMGDKFDAVADFASKQARKMWQVIRQFVDLEEIQLITGEGGIDETTGQPKYNWMTPIDPSMSEKLNKGEYSFDIDVGATEKPDLPIIRKQLENLANILMGQGVMLAFQQQGYKINLAELFKEYLHTYPNLFKNIGKIIQPISPQTSGLLPPMAPGGMGSPPMSSRGPASQQAGNPPNMADIISEIGGEKGGPPPLA